MGKPVKRANGSWGVQFKIGDVRESGTFATRREAEEWQAGRKLELKAIANRRGGEVKTLGDALEKFRDEVSPMHRGHRSNSPVLPMSSTSMSARKARTRTRFSPWT